MKNILISIILLLSNSFAYGVTDALECPICLDTLDNSDSELPCSHRIHSFCLEQLRKINVNQVCPVCRDPLPPSMEEKLFEEGFSIYSKLKSSFDQGEISWTTLSKEQKRFIDLWSIAAFKGNPSAQYYLGLCYKDGRGVEINSIKALELFRLASAQGHTEAQFNLGLFYYEGKLVSVDFCEAIKWFYLAAEKNHEEAQCIIGICYVNGQGVTQNFSQALSWLYSCQSQGNSKAILTIGEVKKRIIKIKRQRRLSLWRSFFMREEKIFHSR